MAGVKPVDYFRAMSQQLEQRVKKLEKQVVALVTRAVGTRRRKDWRRTIGIFQNDSDFEQAVRLGREYRKKQTYRKEIARS